MNLSIRTRLTLWYVGVLMVVLGIYIAAVFSFQYVQLRGQLYRDEMRETEAVEGLLYFSGDGQLRLRDEYYSHPKSRLLVDRLLEVHDAQGSVLLRSSTLQGRELGRPSYPQEGKQWFERRDVRLSDGTRVLMVSHLHPVDGRMLLIRLGYDLHPLTQRMLQFAGVLLLALPLALLAASWAGYRLSRRAFAPLEAMTANAEQITASNLSDRVQIANPEDELGRMGGVLNLLLERLERAFQQLQRFTADAAHELRTPLAALRSMGEAALGATSGSPEPKEVISSMLEEAERLSETVDGLLLLSRAESTPLSLTLSRFTLPELGQEIVALLEVLLEEQDIEIREIELEGGTGQILADRALVRSALLNVLHNAIKYSPPHSVIAVTYSQRLHAGRYMQQVAVEDHGPGLAPGEQERVFERFYRGRGQANPGGAGLGLAIARLAVEHSDGTIFMDESYASGTRCCILLPAEQPVGQ